jgi:alpha-glucosidase
VNTTDLPELQEIVVALRRVVDEFPDRVMIGEIYLPIERLVAYYGADLNGAHLPFNFSLIEAPWDAVSIMRAIETYERALPAGGWPNWVLGNHDRPRIASRVGAAQARIAAMLLLTLRGTPTIYYGEEIGMLALLIAPDKLHDPIGDSIPGLSHGRDSVRTPMHWDASAHAGFTKGTPWLPIGDNAADNVAGQRQDRRSIFNLYRRLTGLRRSSTALRAGHYGNIVAHDHTLAFTRETDTERMLIALNFAAASATLRLSPEQATGVIVLSSFADRENDPINGAVTLRANEGVVIRLMPRA